MTGIFVFDAVSAETASNTKAKCNLPWREFFKAEIFLSENVTEGDQSMRPCIDYRQCISMGEQALPFEEKDKA